MVGGPLTQQFSHRTRVRNFIGGSTSKVVSRHVADRIARGLQRVHFHIGQCLEDIRHVLQFRPVVLDVLTGGEVAVALVPLFRNHRELAHLTAVERAIGDRNAQHVGVQLQIQTVHQAERTEFVFGQLTFNAAFHLIAELRNARADKGFVKVVILIH